MIESLVNYLKNTKDIAVGLMQKKIKFNEIQWKSSEIPVKLDNGNTISIPAYSTFKLGPFNCSKLTRLIAEKLFNLNYSPSAAWDRRYHCEQVIPLSGELNRYSDQLEPGSIVGIKIPNSEYNKGKDEQGKERAYSHVAIYIGKDKDSNPLFADQYKTRVRVQNLSKLEKENLKLVEILK